MELVEFPLTVRVPCAVRVSFVVADWPGRLRMAWSILRGQKTEINVHADELQVTREEPTPALHPYQEGR